MATAWRKHFFQVPCVVALAVMLLWTAAMAQTDIVINYPYTGASTSDQLQPISVSFASAGVPRPDSLRIEINHLSTTSWTTPSSGASYDLQDIYMVPGSTTGYAVGSNRTILKTTTTGTSWTRVLSTCCTEMHGVWATDANNVYVVGNIGRWATERIDSIFIWKSTNGGTSWSVYSANTFKVLNAITFVNATVGIAVGEDGTIVRTADAGLTWTEVGPATPRLNFKAVNFPTDSVGYAVGERGLLYKTEDMGLTWTELYAYTNADLWAVNFQTDSIGFFAGAMATIMKTTDGGLTWFSRYEGATNTFFGIALDAAGAGYAVASNGMVLRTVNGGESWLNVRPTVRNLYAMAMVDANTMIGVGEHGVTVKTTNGGWTRVTETFWVVDSTSITYSPRLFTYTPFVAYIPGDSVNWKILGAVDYSGNVLSGNDTSHWFFIDNTCPFVTNAYPVNGVTLNDPHERITISLDDAFSSINPEDFIMDVQGQQYRYSVPGVGGVILLWDETAKTLTFDPNACATFPFANADTVNITLLQAIDAPAYGTGTQLCATYSWHYYIDAVEPGIFPLEPLQGQVTACADQHIVVRVVDNVAWAETELRVHVWSTSRAEEVYYVGHPRSSFDPATGVFEMWPMVDWVDGDSVWVRVEDITDIHGNTVPGMTWSFYVDLDGVQLVSYYPPNGSLVTDTIQRFSITLTHDQPIDWDNFELIVRCNQGLKTYFNDHTNPELMISGNTLTYIVENSSWLRWNIDPPGGGDTVFVTLLRVANVVDYCAGHQVTDLPLTFMFMVAAGPVVTPVEPLPNWTTNCGDKRIKIRIDSPNGIDLTTIHLRVEGTDYFWPDPSLTWNAGQKVLTWTPAVGSEFVDGQVVDVTLFSVDDLLGHPMENAPLRYHFLVDMTPPIAFDPYPVNQPWPYAQPIISLAIRDIYSPIDPYSFILRVDGIDYYFSHPSITWVQDSLHGGRVFWNAAEAERTFEDGHVVNVCLIRAYDLLDYYCGGYGNNIDSEYCWSFTIDLSTPIPMITSPAPGAYTTCVREPIVIHLSEPVNPLPTLLIVDGIFYNNDSSQVSWNADFTALIFTPDFDWAEGAHAFTLMQWADLAGNIVHYGPYVTGFFYDGTAPVVVPVSPMSGDTVSAHVGDITMQITDNLAGVDFNTLDVTLSSGPVRWDAVTSSWVFYPNEINFYHVADYPGIFTYVGGLLTINWPATGMLFNGGDRVEVNVVVADNAVGFGCSTVNTQNYTYGFTAGIGWFFTVTEGINTLTLGATLNATDEFDFGLDVPAPPPMPDETGIEFRYGGTDPLITSLIQDWRSLESCLETWDIQTGGDLAGVLRWDNASLPTHGVFLIWQLSNPSLRYDMRIYDTLAFDPNARIIIQYCCYNMNLVRGWNLISLPVEPYDHHTEVLFPTAIQVLGYDAGTGSYYTPEYMQTGLGYWVLVDAAISYQIEGTLFDRISVPVTPGWNLVGSISNYGSNSFRFAPSTIHTVFGFDNATGSYYTTDYVAAGIGYWVIVADNASFVVVSDLPLLGRDPITVNTLDWSIPVAVGTQRVVLGASNGSVDGYDVADIAAPPAAPGTDNDAYLSCSETWLKRLATDARNVTDGTTWTLVVNTEHSVTLNWDITAVPAGWTITAMRNGEVVDLNGYTVDGSAKFLITARNVLPSVNANEVSLGQNMPNPFDRTTSISYVLPEPGTVTLDVYTLAGTKIRTLINGAQAAGTYTVNWDGRDDLGQNLTNGVYFYRMVSGTQSQIRQMLLVK